MIRSFDWRDVGLVKTLADRGVCLDSETGLTEGNHALQHALVSYLMPMAGSPTLIWLADGHHPAALRHPLHRHLSHRHLPRLHLPRLHLPHLHLPRLLLPRRHLLRRHLLSRHLLSRHLPRLRLPRLRLPHRR